MNINKTWWSMTVALALMSALLHTAQAGVIGEPTLAEAGDTPLTARWPVNGHRYMVVLQSLTWPMAELAARSAGGYLATLELPGENEFVYELIEPIAEAWLPFHVPMSYHGAFTNRVAHRTG